jgi:XTP/dITP diphosphohydrolase
MKQPRKILIGSNNAHKLKEIQEILDAFEFVTPASLGLDLDIDESGMTFAENAEIKARAFAQASGLPTLADDSGLMVEALDGAPGVHSHRYSPKPDATDADRRAFLLENLKSSARPWKAKFVCAAVYYDPATEKLLHASGECAGEILPEERGSGGFGYDPVFFFPQLGKTLAELSEDEKNAISHRGNAMRKMRIELESE